MAHHAGGPPLDPDLANAIKQLAVASGDANVFHDILAEYTAVGRAFHSHGCLLTVSSVRNCTPSLSSKPIVCKATWCWLLYS